MADEFKNLENKIAQFKSGEKLKSDKTPGGNESRTMSAGMRAGSEFITYVISGAIAGFFADRFFGTPPLMLVIMLFSGFGYGIFRAAKIMK